MARVPETKGLDGNHNAAAINVAVIRILAEELGGIVFPESKHPLTSVRTQLLTSPTIRDLFYVFMAQVFIFPLPEVYQCLKRHWPEDSRGECVLHHEWITRSRCGDPIVPAFSSYYDAVSSQDESNPTTETYEVVDYDLKLTELIFGPTLTGAARPFRTTPDYSATEEDMSAQVNVAFALFQGHLLKAIRLPAKRIGASIYDDEDVLLKLQALPADIQVVAIRILLDVMVLLSLDVVEHELPKNLYSLHIALGDDARQIAPGNDTPFNGVATIPTMYHLGATPHPGIPLGYNGFDAETIESMHKFLKSSIPGKPDNSEKAFGGAWLTNNDVANIWRIPAYTALQAELLSAIATRIFQSSINSGRDRGEVVKRHLQSLIYALTTRDQYMTLHPRDDKENRKKLKSARPKGPSKLTGASLAIIDAVRRSIWKFIDISAGNTADHLGIVGAERALWYLAHLDTPQQQTRAVQTILGYGLLHWFGITQLESYQWQVSQGERASRKDKHKKAADR